MAQKVRELMTSALVSVQPSQPLTAAAQAMRDQGVGAVLVIDGGKLKALLTDRDIVIRVVAEGKDPGKTPVAEACSPDLVTVRPGDEADKAIRRMREHGVRRVPVVDNGKPVGILSIGDMAIERDENSALADISAKAPNT
jgi:CBS domain-containing protein